MTATAQPARTAVYVGNAGTSDVSVMLLDPASGALEPIERVPIPGVSGAGSSTPMALGPGGRVLHVGFRGQPYVVASFAIDRASGRLSHIGNGPLADNLAYLSVDPTGRHLFGASYFSSRLTVNPIAPDGNVLPATHIRETGAKAHCALLGPDGRHVLVTSLGTDRIHRYGWEPESGEISLAPVGDVAVAAGAGPRHIVFHPNGRAAYLVNELNGTVDVFAHESGTLVPSGTVSIMPAGDSRKPWAADIHITPDGRFLYASERTSSTISGFAVDADGDRAPILADRRHGSRAARLQHRSGGGMPRGGGAGYGPRRMLPDRPRVRRVDGGREASGRREPELDRDGVAAGQLRSRRRRAPPRVLFAVGGADLDQFARIGVLDAARLQIGDGKLFDDPALLHDHQPVAHMGDDGEIVADQDVGEVRARREGRSSRLRISAWTETSSAEVGSSRSRTSGSSISARAMATRWRWPPESWCG